MIAAYVWLGCAWIFILAVLFKRWRERERHEAAVTQRVMESLAADTTNDHIWDGA